MTLIYQSRKVQSIIEKSWYYDLWKFSASIDPSLGLADLCWNIPEEVISHINSRSFSSPHCIVTIKQPLIVVLRDMVF